MNPKESPTTKITPPPAFRGPMAGPGAGGMGRMMAGAVEKPKNFKSAMKNLMRYLKPFKLSLVIVFVFAIASTVFAIVGPKLLGRMTNDIVDDYIAMTTYDQVIARLPKGAKLPAGTTGDSIIRKIPPQELSKIPKDKIDKIRKIDFSHRPQINFNRIGKIAVLLLVLYLLSSFFSYIQGWLMSGIAQKISYRFRRDIAEKINKLPLKYFDKKTHGEVLSRVTNDVDTVSQTLNQSLTQIVTSVTTIIGILIMMITISWMLTGVALLMLPISFGLIGVIIKKSQHYFKEQQDTLGKLNGHIEEMYSGHNVMKVFNGESRSVEQFQYINNDLYKSAWRSQFLSGLMWPIMSFMGNLSYVGIAVLGGWLAVNGKINIGDIQAFIQYVNQFNQPIIQTANVANVLQSTAAASERVFEFLNEQEEVLESSNPVIIEKVKGKVEFDNVIFGYDPEKVVIKGFSSKISPGQRIAIVGPTGAGKTTMVNLLMRFYDVKEGSIRVDDVDIRDMKRSDLRKMFGMVLQDSWLFNGSIKDNITYSNPNATEEEIYNAAKAAHVDHFVRSLPNGYNFELNEEADNISQGEKQLLCIARVMLADSPILILDEATSSVDTRTEVLIQKAMDTLMKGKTSFVIAHRLSTIKNADLILVMRDGNIVEQGTHQELLDQNGFYAMLYNSQFTEVEESN